jgi:LPS export ABC transporter protein LptC
MATRMQTHGARRKRVALAAIILVTALAAAVYFGYQRLVSVVSVGKPEAPASTGTEAMHVERIHQSSTKDGRTEWNLDAASAQYLLPEKRMLLTDLFVTFFTKEGQKVYLTARHGTVRTDSHDMEAHDDVVVYNDLYRMNAERMTYAQDSRVITCDTPVKITSQAGEILADSLTMNLNTNRLVMKGHVHGTLESSETR